MTTGRFKVTDEVLGEFETSVARACSGLDGTVDASNEAASAVGYHPLESKLSDFSHNWRLHRESLVKKLHTLGDDVARAQDELRTWDDGVRDGLTGPGPRQAPHPIGPVPGPGPRTGTDRSTGNPGTAGHAPAATPFAHAGIPTAGTAAATSPDSGSSSVTDVGQSPDPTPTSTQATPPVGPGSPATGAPAGLSPGAVPPIDHAAGDGLGIQHDSPLHNGPHHGGHHRPDHAGAGHHGHHTHGHPGHHEHGGGGHLGGGLPSAGGFGSLGGSGSVASLPDLAGSNDQGTTSHEAVPVAAEGLGSAHHAVHAIGSAVAGAGHVVSDHAHSAGMVGGAAMGGMAAMGAGGNGRSQDPTRDLSDDERVRRARAALELMRAEPDDEDPA